MRMSLTRFIGALTSVVIGACFSVFVSAHSADSSAKSHSTKEANTATVAKLPPLPAGVTELSFSDFFKMPIGPLGLDPTEKLLSLDNKRVRIVGYMAQEDDPTPGFFMLAGRPVTVGEKADGMADDLPANTLFVHMPSIDADKVLTYRPGLWVLTGILQVGNKEEVAANRISFVRLVMEQRDIDEAQKNSKKHLAQNR